MNFLWMFWPKLFFSSINKIECWGNVEQDKIVKININIVSVGSVVVFPDVQVVYVGKNTNWTVLVWKCFSLISDFLWKSGVYRFTRRRGEYRYFLWQIRRRIFLSYLTYFDAESQDYCIVQSFPASLLLLWVIFRVFYLRYLIIPCCHVIKIN